jgi:hypothetical protein
MKKILFFIIYLLSVFPNAYAQDTIPAKIDINKKVSFFERSLPSVNNGYVLWIIDGKLIDDTISTDFLKDINPNTIYSLKMLKVATNDTYHGAQGIIIINTKMYAAAQYEKKLSSFSKKYKSYLAYHHDDKYCLYVLNGIPIDGKLDDRIRKLNEIPAEKIKTVNIRADYGSINNKEIIIITAIK